MTKAEKTKRAEECKAALRKLLKPGATVYNVLCSVSRSGMTREIKSYAIVDGRMQYLSGYMSGAMDERRGKREGLVVGGCGMDMGWHLVMNLAYDLYPEGFGCTGNSANGRNRCPSNDHSNGDADRTRHTKSRPHWHKSGGYALRAEWL